MKHHHVFCPLIPSSILKIIFIISQQIYKLPEHILRLQKKKKKKTEQTKTVKVLKTLIFRVTTSWRKITRWQTVDSSNKKDHKVGLSTFWGCCCSRSCCLRCSRFCCCNCSAIWWKMELFTDSETWELQWKKSVNIF